MTHHSASLCLLHCRYKPAYADLLITPAMRKHDIIQYNDDNAHSVSLTVCEVFTAFLLLIHHGF